MKKYFWFFDFESYDGKIEESYSTGFHWTN